MVHLKLLKLLLVFLLCLREDVIPVLVKFLVLLDVSLLDFLLTLLMHEYKLLVLHVELLLLQLEDAILRHLSLYDKPNKMRAKSKTNPGVSMTTYRHICLLPRKSVCVVPWRHCTGFKSQST